LTVILTIEVAFVGAKGKSEELDAAETG